MTSCERGAHDAVELREPLPELGEPRVERSELRCEPERLVQRPRERAASLDTVQVSGERGGRKL